MIVAAKFATFLSKIVKGFSSPKLVIISLFSCLLVATLFSVASIAYQAHIGLPAGVKSGNYLSFGRVTEVSAFERVSLNELEVLATAFPEMDLGWEMDWFPYDLTVGSKKLSQINVTGVSGNYFEVLGVKPQHGRLEISVQEGMVVVLSADMYQRVLGFDGQELVSLHVTFFDDLVVPVVGVAGGGFQGLDPSNAIDLWVVNPTAAVAQDLRRMPEELAQAAFKGMMGIWIIGKTKYERFNLLSIVAESYTFNKDIPGLPISTGAKENDKIIYHDGIVRNVELSREVKNNINELLFSLLFLFPLALITLIQVLHLRLIKERQKVRISVVSGASTLQLWGQFVNENIGYALCVIIIGIGMGFMLVKAIIEIPPFMFVLNHFSTEALLFGGGGIILMVMLVISILGYMYFRTYFIKTLVELKRSNISRNQTRQVILQRLLLLFGFGVLLYASSRVTIIYQESRLVDAITQESVNYVEVITPDAVSVDDNRVESLIQAVAGVKNVTATSALPFTSTSVNFGIEQGFVLDAVRDLKVSVKFVRADTEFFNTLGIVGHYSGVSPEIKSGEVVLSKSLSRLLEYEMDVDMGSNVTLERENLKFSSHGSAVAVVRDVVDDMPFEHYLQDSMLTAYVSPNQLFYSGLATDSAIVREGRIDRQLILLSTHSRNNFVVDEVMSELKSSGYEVRPLGSPFALFWDQLKEARVLGLLKSIGAAFGFLLMLLGFTMYLVSDCLGRTREFGLELAFGQSWFQLVNKLSRISVMESIYAAFVISVSVLILKFTGLVQILDVTTWMLLPVTLVFIAMVLIINISIIAWLIRYKSIHSLLTE